MNVRSLKELFVVLEQALEGCNLLAADALSTELAEQLALDPDAAEPAQVLSAVEALRRKRAFAPLQRIAEVYLGHAPLPALRYQYAQALIDQDQITGALSVLQRLLSEPGVEPDVREQARGLLGRAYKQAFVRAADAAKLAGEPSPFHAQEALRLAVSSYADALEKAQRDRHWPKANLIACLARARIEGVENLPYEKPPKELARELLRELGPLLVLREPDDVKPWLLASALEASLALGDDQRTLELGRRYLASAAADAFEFGSTHRQFSEIWRLHHSESPRARELLALLEAQLLKSRGGLVDRAAGTLALQAGRELQALWGDERFQTYKWMRSGVLAGDAVARIEDLNGKPKGTGFVLRGSLLHAAWGEEPVLLTNRHVVDEQDARALPPSCVCLNFTTHPAGDDDPPLRAEKILWKSPDGDRSLDVCVLKLGDRPRKRAELTEGELGNLNLKREPPARLYVIGHPLGHNQVSYSLYDNALVALEEPFLYYRSPTLEGNSGSPIFDADWRLLGIHHSADRARKANVGSCLRAIRAAIQASAGPP